MAISPDKHALNMVKRWGLSRYQSLVNHCGRYLSVALLVKTVVGAVGVALAVVSLPLLAAVICVVSVITALVFAISTYHLLRKERAVLRWQLVENKRLQQGKLEAEQQLDNTVLTLMGSSREKQLRLRPSELAQAVKVLKFNASPRLDRVAPNKPDLGPVKARIEKRNSEWTLLEAEIQSLATDDAMEEAMAVKEATKYAKLAGRAALQADEEARERKRRGLKPTAPIGENQLQINADVTGKRKIKQMQRSRSPEEIAQGHFEPPDEVSEPAQ